jgi:hypothetical protein
MLLSSKAELSMGLRLRMAMISMICMFSVSDEVA